MTSFHAVLEALAIEGDTFTIQAPEDWGQGRTLYGGMTAALAYEAVRRTYSELPPLRSAQLTFTGPTSGALRFHTKVLRRGKSSALIASECFNENGEAARAVFVFGGARDSKIAHNYLPIPQVMPPAECPPFRKEGGNTSRGFWNNFETRLAAGGRLLDQSAERPRFAVWTRLVDAGAANLTTALLAIADCMPPAAMVHFPAPAPISTMTWTIDVAAFPTDPSGWFLLASSSEHAADGYSLQSMSMWSAAGDLLSVGRQTVAIFI